MLRTIAAHLLRQPLARFIVKERDRLSRDSRHLTAEEKEELRSHFSSIDLDRVRLVIGQIVHEPGFVAILRRLGVDIPSTMLAEAVTLDYLIVASEPISGGTLFHEMVHTVQYRLLGISLFAYNYVRDFLTSGYEKSPMEHVAAQLSERFEQGKQFDVELEIRIRTSKL